MIYERCTSTQLQGVPKKRVHYAIGTFCLFYRVCSAAGHRRGAFRHRRQAAHTLGLPDIAGRLPDITTRQHTPPCYQTSPPAAQHCPASPPGCPVPIIAARLPDIATRMPDIAAGQPTKTIQLSTSPIDAIVFIYQYYSYYYYVVLTYCNS